jgi:signal transduction histidine kinase
MIDLGTLSIRNGNAVVEARRKLARVATALALDAIGSTCVATGVSEVTRRVLSVQEHFELGVAIRTEPPRSTLVLYFACVSLRPEESGVMELFDSVKLFSRLGKRLIICTKDVPLHTRHLTPEFVEYERRLLHERSRDELIQEMHTINEELKAKNVQLEDFTFSSAHTLKTDWLGVGYLVEELVEVMESDGFVKGTEAYELMSEIRLRVGRGARTVDDLLAYSTLGTGVERTPQSILDVVKNAVTSAANPRLCIDPDFKDVVLPLDAVKFAMALEQILNNAITYGLGRSVDIQCDGHELRIRDHGRGIPKESLVEIFGLFRRNAVDSTGSGIGLAIAKQVVAAHGYRIWAESEGVGHGSTFVLQFSQMPDADTVGQRPTVAGSLMPSRAPRG